MSLAEAQADKHELICRKLGLHEAPGRRLLDVGCGWGSLAMHAAQRHQARVVGITISREQAGAGTGARRPPPGSTTWSTSGSRTTGSSAARQFDAIASVGMFEHVGLRADAAVLRGAPRPPSSRPGRLLNHAISSVGGSRIGGRSFVHRYVFPDGELIDVGEVVLAMERAGFEVRDVESLREHYALTLRCVGREPRGRAGIGRSSWSAPNRARVWRLYMAASALGFEDGGLDLHQVLGVVPEPDGASGMPTTRDGWSTATR